MKAIIMAGGTGSRLFPNNLATNKHLLPVYDKPLIYYPLSTLMLAGIDEFLIVTNSSDVPSFEKLLGNGSHLGVRINYVEQPEANGIAAGLIYGEKFIGNEPVCVALGDNIFLGQSFGVTLKEAMSANVGCTVFSTQVRDAERYGVIEFDNDEKPKRLVEKPRNPSSNWIATGLYYFDKSASEKAKCLKISSRKELEITDLINSYNFSNEFNIVKLGRGFYWKDAGTIDGLFDASSHIRTFQEASGFTVACIEEIAVRSGFLQIEKIMPQPIPEYRNNYQKHISRMISKRL